VAYRGPAFTVTADQVLEPSGVRTRRDIVHHSGSVVILAVEESNSEPLVLLDSSIVMPHNKRFWELPAGGSMMARRLGRANATAGGNGYTASRWKCILRFYASPAFGRNNDMYSARGLRRGKASGGDEVIRSQMVPLSPPLHGHEGHIRDAKTMPGCSGSTSHNMAESRTHADSL